MRPCVAAVRRSMLTNRKWEMLGVLVGGTSWAQSSDFVTNDFEKS